MNTKSNIKLKSDIDEIGKRIDNIEKHLNDEEHIKLEWAIAQFMHMDKTPEQIKAWDIILEYIRKTY